MIVLKGMRDEVRQLAITNGGNYLVARGERGTQIWRSLAGPADVIPVLAGPGYLSFHPDGERLITDFPGSGYYEIAKERFTEFRSAREPRACVPTAEGDSILAVYDERPRITCWPLDSVERGRPRWSIPIDAYILRRPLVAADGRFVVPTILSRELSRGRRQYGYLHNQFTTRTGKMIATTEVVDFGSDWEACSADGRWVAGARETRIAVWDFANPKAAPVQWQNNTRKNFTAIAFHPTSRFLAAANNDGTVRYYGVESWTPMQTFSPEIGPLRSLCFSPDGTLAAAGSDTGSIAIWDVEY